MASTRTTVVVRGQGITHVERPPEKTAWRILSLPRLICDFTAPTGKPVTSLAPPCDSPCAQQSTITARSSSVRIASIRSRSADRRVPGQSGLSAARRDAPCTQSSTRDSTWQRWPGKTRPARAPRPRSSTKPMHRNSKIDVQDVTGISISGEYSTASFPMQAVSVPALCRYDAARGHFGCRKRPLAHNCARAADHDRH